MQIYVFIDGYALCGLLQGRMMVCCDDKTGFRLSRLMHVAAS